MDIKHVPRPVTVTKEHWTRGLSDAPPKLKLKATMYAYSSSCAVAHALRDAGYDVESVGHKHFLDVFGNRFEMTAAAGRLVSMFDQADTALNRGLVPEVPEFPITFFITQVERK